MNLPRRITLTLAATCLGFSIASTASAESYPQHIEKDLINICEAIQNDDRLDLRRAVKKSGLSYSVLAKGLVCNGEDMMTFAMNNNAIDTHDYLARYLDADARALTAKR